MNFYFHWAKWNIKFMKHWTSISQIKWQEFWQRNHWKKSFKLMDFNCSCNFDRFLVVQIYGLCGLVPGRYIEYVTITPAMYLAQRPVYQDTVDVVYVDLSPLVILSMLKLHQLCIWHNVLCTRILLMWFMLTCPRSLYWVC